MQVVEETERRVVLCETHNRYCAFSSNQKCPCCGKRVCLCNYVL